MNFNRLKQNKQKLFVAAAVLWLLVCMLVTPVYTTVTLTFAEDPAGEVITTVYAGPRNNISPSDARSRVVNSGVARISWLDFQYGSHCSLKRIDPVQQAYDGALTIEKLTVRKNGLPVISISGGELKNYFTGNEQTAFTDGADFAFTVTGCAASGLPVLRRADPAALFPDSKGSGLCEGWNAVPESQLPDFSAGGAWSGVDVRLYGAPKSFLAEPGRI